MPKVGDFWESYRANEFVLVIDGRASPGVTKISGLSEGEIDTIEQPDGGTNHVYKVAATKVKFESLTIERLRRRQPGGQALQRLVPADLQAEHGKQGGSSCARTA